MTNYYNFAFDSWNRVDLAIAYNRSNGGVAFVFVKNFGRETRLMVCECPKFFTSAKSHTPEQITHLVSPKF